MTELSTQHPRQTGEWLRLSTGDLPFESFLPFPLPPDPVLDLEKFEDLQARANRALGGLDQISRFLPDKRLFLYSYVRKEALLSSQIEGTQSSLSDLLLFENEEAPGVPVDDVAEVSCYVRALEAGIEKMREGQPITINLLKEIHATLLQGGRGGSRNPGDFRRVQVRIGGTNEANATFVPPPAQHVPELMGDLEKFVNDEPRRTSTLLKAALAHVQFETIHPFLDGNGRLGRLLITLLLVREQAISEPMLYLSLFFKTNREKYYDLLQAVRTKGEWEAWYEFFLTGVYTVAEGAAQTAQRLIELFEADRKKLEQQQRSSGTLIRVHEVLKRKIAISTNDVIAQTGLTRPTAIAAFAKMTELGMVNEVTGKKRNTVFVYPAYLNILSEGAEPL